MHYRFFIKINRITIRAISWYILKDFSYSKMYSLNRKLKLVSANPVPRTPLESDWILVPNKDRIERSKPFEVLDTPPHHVTIWNLDSLRNFAKFLDLDLINARAPKESSNCKIIQGIRRYNFSKEFSRAVFYKIQLLKRDRPRGCQLFAQLKIRNVLN